MVRSTASRSPSLGGSCSASQDQPRAQASNSTTTSASPTPTCSTRSQGSSCSRLGAMTRNSASASASARRVHTTDDTATAIGTPARCTITCTRAASPATATDRSFTAAPTRVASWASRQLWGATGFSTRCHPHPLATSEERLAASAAAVALRIVAIAVMQQDDGTGPELAAHARPDLLRRDAWVRVPHAEGPAEDGITQPARDAPHERIAVPVRRAEDPRRALRGLDDQGVSALELLADAVRPGEMQLAVAQRVVADLMPRAGNAARDLGKAPHVLPDQEKRRRDALGREGFEDRLRGPGVGTVVEREVSHAPGARPPADHAPEQRAVGLVRAVGPGAQGGARGGERKQHGGIINTKPPGRHEPPPGGSTHRLPGAGGLLPPFFILPPPVD